MEASVSHLFNKRSIERANTLLPPGHSLGRARRVRRGRVRLWHCRLVRAGV